jgi:hypothetical protein
VRSGDEVAVVFKAFSRRADIGHRPAQYDGEKCVVKWLGRHSFTEADAAAIVALCALEAGQARCFDGGPVQGGSKLKSWIAPPPVTLSQYPRYRRAPNCCRLYGVRVAIRVCCNHVTQAKI